MTDTKNKKVILAYSGGLDTSIILKWLILQGYDVIAFLADLGQKEDMEAAKAKALSLGASKVYIENLRKEFVTDFIYPAYAANAVYEGRYLLGTSLARPIIAKKQIEIANKEGADYVSHGATGKGNDQVRFELTYYALKPDVKVLAPWKMPEFLAEFKGRSDMLAFAERHRIPVTATKAKPYSEDENLLHISHEAGILEDPWAACAENVYSRTASVADAPDAAEIIQIDFEKGIPVRLLSGGATETDPLTLFETLNALGGKHGIGRVDMVENRFVGIKSRGVYETPGGTILLAAHRDLEGITLDREVMKIRDHLSITMAELIYNGFWYSPEMELLMHTMCKAQERVNGSVKVQLLKGNAYPIARQSPNSLYNPQLSSMDEEGGYNQEDAGGFIRINAIRLKAHHVVGKGKK